MELTKQFAKFIVGTNYSDIPGEVKAEARIRLLDTIGDMFS